MGKEETKDRLRLRHRRSRLECESSGLLMYVADLLAEVFPEAKFILPIRSPRPWLRSILNQHIYHPVDELGAEYQKARALSRSVYTSEGAPAHPPEEHVLAEYDMWTLDSYLSFWREHNKRVLERVPHERLLVLRTRDLSDSIDRIATFAGAPSSALNGGRSHANRAPQRHGIVDEIDEAYLDEKIEAHCGRLRHRIEEK